MDLNDLRYFALVVEHGGFSAAERHAHITKSKLSRRISLLEARLGTRLFQRSTRRLSSTEAGHVFYEHCAAMLIEAEAAQHAVEQLRSEPSGTVRLTCPVSMAQFYVARLIADFMRLHPRVRIELDATDRMVNLIDERIDIALRARDSGLKDPGLVAVRIASSRLILVAAPGYVGARQSIEDPAQLADLDTIGALREGKNQVWPLVTADEGSFTLTHQPRLLCSDFTVQQHAAINGVGVALLPVRVASDALKHGTLVRIASAWSTPTQDIHLVFASRRGMLPSVRKLIDYLTLHVPMALVE